MNPEFRKLSFAYKEACPDEVSNFYRQKISPIKFAPLSAKKTISNRHKQVSFQDWQLWSCDCESGMTLSYADAEPLENFVVYLPRSSSMEIDAGICSITSDHVGPVVADMSRFDRVVLGPQRAHLAVSFSKKAIVQQLSHMIDDAVMKDVSFDRDVDCGSALGKVFCDSAETIWNQIDSESGPRSAIYYRNALNTLTSLLIETVPNNFSSRIARGGSPAVPKNVKRAIEYMNAHANSRISIEDIAIASGTSVRALQSAFKSFKDATPLSYLGSIRLQNAREKLLDKTNNNSVSEIAYAAGFTHLGRFANLYASAFGETPSQTLKSAR